MGKGIIDRQVARDAIIGRVADAIGFNPAVSLTDRAFEVFKPGYRFKIEDVESWCATKAGAVSYSGLVVPNGTGVITAGVISVHSTPTQLALTAMKALAGGVVVEKGAATGLTFTAAHVVAANTFGVVLIQMDNAGAISSKVPLATQSYASTNDAIANLPLPDTGKVAIGYLVIDALTATPWTANTSNMTAASGLDAITIVNTAAITKAFTAAAVTALTPVKATLSTTLSAISGKPADYIVLLGTTDGTGALTHGRIRLRYRPYPMNGD